MANKKENQKNHISTSLVYLDVKTILENYRDPKFWEKEWLIFKNKEIEIKWRVTKINVLSNAIESCIFFNKGTITRGNKKFDIPYYYTTPNRASWYEGFCRPIPINNSDYNQKTFERNILGTILNALYDIEKEMSKETYEYKKARETQDAQIEKLQDIAEQFLNENNVFNEDIRQAYINDYIRKNRYYGIVDDVLNHSKFRFFKTIYLHVCSWFNNSTYFDEYKKELSSYVPKKTIFRILKIVKEMQTEEWKQSMKDRLPSF